MVSALFSEYHIEDEQGVLSPTTWIPFRGW